MPEPPLTPFGRLQVIGFLKIGPVNPLNDQWASRSPGG
jgi:hypothetical protein